MVGESLDDENNVPQPGKQNPSVPDEKLPTGSKVSVYALQAPAIYLSYPCLQE